MNIYAYYLPSSPNRLKIGQTSGEVAARVRQQRTGMAEDPIIVLDEEAGNLPNGEGLTDHMIHAELERRGIRRINREWFEAGLDDLRDALHALRSGVVTDRGRNLRFGMRPEQRAAVDRTERYFRSEGGDRRFLWNAKMRFGKTFTTYQLARRMGWTRILVLTYKPAVETAWDEDLRTHADFAGWRFIRNGESAEGLDDPAPLVWFTSIQALLNRDEQGEMSERFDALKEIEWDCVVIDEYHFGAWRDAAKDIYDKKEAEVADADDAAPEDIPVRSQHYLYLSGTPFRALASGEFMEDQIFNWTYQDEQSAKDRWTGADNPYASLPQMQVMTYKLPDDLRAIAEREGMEFSLNEFFKAEKDADRKPKFVYENEVQRWLEMQRGRLGHYGDAVHDRVRPPLPFEDTELLDALRHTIWFLPSVDACEAMKDLLEAPRNAATYGAYKVVVAAGNKAGMGAKALGPVRKAMGDDPRETRTITLSCGKLMTGVSVPAWAGIFMLRGIQSPEGYFQSAFRVQTPWTEKVVEDGREVREIVKPTCYVFDYDPNRALRLIADYHGRLGGVLDEAPARSAEESLREFLRFMPVLAYDGASMVRIDAGQLLDIAVAGIGAGMLAKRWQSATMVNVDTATLDRLLQREDVLAALSRIEAFRNLNKDIEKVVSSNRAIKKAKLEGRKPNQEEAKEKDRADSTRKQIRENLLKFITRIPVFMYLTDNREESVSDVIRHLEPELFTRVTGLEVADFDALCDIGVFNRDVMNGAILAFRRFEDPSLTYAGGEIIDQEVGMFDDRIYREFAYL